MVELSNALNNNGKISERISSCGVFSKMIWRFSNIVTVAWIDFGAAKTTLQKLYVFFFVQICLKMFEYTINYYLNVGNRKFSYSFWVASATNDNAGCKTAANTSPNRISCCKHGQICCHHSFYKYIDWKYT